MRTAPLHVVCSGERQHDLLFVPLQSWYHSSWDCEPDHYDRFGATEETDLRSSWADFHRCRWTPPLSDEPGSTSIAERFAAMNQPMLQQLVAATPARQGGRHPPKKRLSKAETYAVYGETPLTKVSPRTSRLEVDSLSWRLGL